MKKALLVGNGFTSQIIPDYSGPVLMDKVYSLIPDEMKKIENIFNPFRIKDFDANPYYYELNTNYEFDDDDDWVIGYVPTYSTETFSPILYNRICEILSNKCNIKNAANVCQRLFIDAGLYHEMNKSKLMGIETPLKIIQIAIANGSMSKAEGKKIETTIKSIFFNNGNYHFPKTNDGKGVKVNYRKSVKFFKGFSTIYTTNYDLVIDDLVHDKVKHLHGGLCFPDAYKKDYKYSNPTAYEIVLAADGRGKERQIYRTRETLFSKYLLSLETEDFDELYILGYSGENDMHINNAIKNNNRIKRVYVYVNPTDVKKETLRFHFGTLYRQYPNERIDTYYPYGLELLSWDDFWNQILE